MGTSGERGQGRRLVGSVAQRVIEESPVPAATVRLNQRPVTRNDAGSPQAAPRRSRALVLHDLSPSADQTLSFVRRAFPEAEVSLMHVVQARQSESRRTAARDFLNARGGAASFRATQPTWP